MVAAFSFDEGAGAVADASGNGNDGHDFERDLDERGQVWWCAVFNGTSARVTVPNSASLQLSSGMTLEAWVDPASVSSAWRDVIYKGNDNYYLRAHPTTVVCRPVAAPFAGRTRTPSGRPLAANSWSSLAVTYDGATLRLYVNGTLVASQAKTGAITSSTNQLQIGGDSIYGQYFNGLIDEVRIYNTALTQPRSKPT